MKRPWQSKLYTVFNRAVQLSWSYSKMKTPGVWMFTRKPKRYSFYFALAKVRYKEDYGEVDERLKGKYGNSYAHMFIAGPLMIVVSEKIH